MDKISIITATYNCANEIEKTVLSVLEQDYPSIEHIVIDGASTDGTVDILKKYKDKFAYWVSEPDNGLYYAMNKGIERATGDWIYILNAGGVFPNRNALSEMFKDDHSDSDAIFGYIYSETSNRYYRTPIPFYEIKEAWNRRPGFSHQALFVRSEWLKKYPFDTDFRCCADYNQMTQIYNAGARFKYVDVFIEISAPAGFSAKNRLLQMKETAIINGVDKTLRFKLSYSKRRFVKEVRNLMGGAKIIILGNDHTNTLGLVQTLGRDGYYVIAVVWGAKRGYVKNSRYCRECYSSHTPQDCVELILKLNIDINNIPIIATCDDAACVLEDNRERLSNQFIFEHTKGVYSINELMDKHLQVKLARQAGLKIPKTWTSEEENEFIYPVIIKPEISHFGAKSDIRICKTYDDYIKEKNSLKHTTNFVVQQYIERDYEISILGCSLTNGDVYTPCVENKLTLYPPEVGLECLADMQPLIERSIIDPIASLVKEMGYVGVFSVEMMHCKTDNCYYFTEINLRNDGANSFVYKCGVNLPKMHVRDLKQEPLPTFKVSNTGFYIWDMHHFMALRSHTISFKQWYQELKKSRGFLTYFKDDKKPFFKQYSFLIKRFFSKTKNKYY